MLRFVAALGLLGPLLPSCSGHVPALVDSIGNRVTWECAGHDCEVTGTADEPPMCDGSDVFVIGAGAIAILCAGSVAADHSFVLHETTCRPLVCSAADDCPQWPDRHYGCDGGFCTTSDVAGGLDALDVEAMCLHTHPRGATCAEIDADPVVIEAQRTATAACTGMPCTIPEACRP